VASFANMDTSSNSGHMPGVTRTRGSARADHSIDATPPAAPAPAPQSLEGGLVKKGGFREGAHTAHGNHRSKTICRTNVGVCAFDPHGPYPGYYPACLLRGYRQKAATCLVLSCYYYRAQSMQYALLR
jgi:hypothetical protein